jgi:hypothetical protein
MAVQSEPQGWRGRWWDVLLELLSVVPYIRQVLILPGSGQIPPSHSQRPVSILPGSSGSLGWAGSCRGPVYHVLFRPVCHCQHDRPISRKFLSQEMLPIVLDISFEL